MLRAAVLMGVMAIAAGCSAPATRDTTVPPATVQARGDAVVQRAMGQIGTPYRYGGADLEGFDCSGLVYYIHQQLGFKVPRTAQQQYDASRRISRAELQPGDLVFFRFSGARISHVGIYAGGGRFVHAPQTGRSVELKSLEEPYYVRYYVGAGRLPD